MGLETGKLAERQKESLTESEAFSSMHWVDAEVGIFHLGKGVEWVMKALIAILMRFKNWLHPWKIWTVGFEKYEKLVSYTDYLIGAQGWFFNVTVSLLFRIDECIKV